MLNIANHMEIQDSFNPINKNQKGAGMKKIQLLLLILVISLFAEGSREGDSLALVAIRDVNPGTYIDTLIGTKAWVEGNPIDNWTGVTVKDGRVNRLQLDMLLRNVGAIPPEIGNLTALTYLDLSTNNKIETIPSTIGNLTELVTLRLRNNSIKSLPSTIGNLTELTFLYLSNNQIAELPEELGLLTKIYAMDVNTNALTGLPAGIGNLSKLGTLNLNNNSITAIPATIGKLDSLYGLYLNNNQIESLPKEIGELPKLGILDLSNNKLTSLPLELFNLSTLSTLDLAHNNLTLLAPEIINLTDISVLNLSNNKITVLPPEFGDLGAGNINLDSNSLTALPEEFGNLPVVYGLSLAGNYLASLPEGITKLVLLSDSVPTLEISDNLLFRDSLSEGVVNWLNIYDSDWESSQKGVSFSAGDSLILLSLKEANQLTTLNWEIELICSSWEGVGFTYQDNVKHVNSLVLSGKKLSIITPDIASLTALSILSLTDNSLVTLPDEIVNLSPSELDVSENYLFREHLSDTVISWLDQYDPDWESLQKELTVEDGDSTALYILYMINPHSSLQWDLTTSYKTWEGVTYDNILNRVLKLNLSGKNISVLSSSLSKLDKLSELDISNNSLAALPETMGEMTFLKSLDLSGNELILLDEHITNITPITVLDMGQNQIVEAYLEVSVILWLDQYDPDWRGTQDAVAVQELKRDDNIRSLSARFTGSKIQFSISLPAETQLSLSDLSGRELFSGSVQGNFMKIPPMAKGIYLMRVRNSELTKIMKIRIH